MAQEGLKRSDVDSIRHDVDRAIEDAIANLRGIEDVAQQRLNESREERRQLDIFLDELHYRRKFLEGSGDAPPTDPLTGPLSEAQLNTLERQEETLNQHKVDLQASNAELEQVTSRVSWLIHQIEGACAWVTAPSDANNGDAERGQGLQPASGDQVMWAQIIMGQEAERARLAREIHDGPAQALANTVMRLQLVEQMFRHQPNEVEGELAKLRVAVQDSVKDVRRFLFNLRPASLTDVGLVPTLRQHIRDYSEQYDVEVELNVPDNLRLSPDQELVVFRVIQEALQNIHKHAEATKIEVDLTHRADGPLTVNVHDNGKGFNPKLARQRQPSSSGLVSMRERAATVGGTLQIDSTPGSGTTISLSLPTSRHSATNRR